MKKLLVPVLVTALSLMCACSGTVSETSRSSTSHQEEDISEPASAPQPSLATESSSQSQTPEARNGAGRSDAQRSFDSSSSQSLPPPQQEFLLLDDVVFQTVSLGSISFEVPDFFEVENEDGRLVITHSAMSDSDDPASLNIIYMELFATDISDLMTYSEYDEVEVLEGLADGDNLDFETIRMHERNITVTKNTMGTENQYLFIHQETLYTLVINCLFGMNYFAEVEEHIIESLTFETSNSSQDSAGSTLSEAEKIAAASNEAFKQTRSTFPDSYPYLLFFLVQVDEEKKEIHFIYGYTDDVTKEEAERRAYDDVLSFSEFAHMFSGYAAPDFSQYYLGGIFDEYSLISIGRRKSDSSADNFLLWTINAGQPLR